MVTSVTFSGLPPVVSQMRRELLGCPDQIQHRHADQNQFWRDRVEELLDGVGASSW